MTDEEQEKNGLLVNSGQIVPIFIFIAYSHF